MCKTRVNAEYRVSSGVHSQRVVSWATGKGAFIDQNAIRRRCAGWEKQVSAHVESLQKERVTTDVI
jgi:hypothetical protein